MNLRNYSSWSVSVAREELMKVLRMVRLLKGLLQTLFWPKVRAGYWKEYLYLLMHLSMLSHWGGRRPGISGGFDSSHCPVVGTFDRFNGLSSSVLLTFSCYFDNPLMPWGGHLNRNSQLSSNALPMPGLPPPPPPPPSSLTLIGALLPWFGNTSNIYLPPHTNNNEIKQNSNTKVARKPKRNHGACRYWAPSE